MRRDRERRRSLAAIAALGISIAALEAHAQQPDTWELRAGTWDRSIEAERAGQLAEAEEMLARGWGPEPESYEVTVRRAWLNLRMKKYEQAAALYRLSIPLPGAGPEARQGLASAVAGIGDTQAAEGNTDAAAATWRQALAIDPSRPKLQEAIDKAEDRRPVRPEVWAGYMFKRAGGPAFSGWAVFGQLPMLVTRELSLRMAFRHAEVSRSIGGSQGQGMRGRSTSTDETQRQNEVYLGAGYEKKWYGGEVLGGVVLPSYEDTGWIAAARMRAGYTWGLNVQGAGIHRQFGWGGQVLPTLFVWPAPWIGLAAGPRLTSDPKGTVASGFAGVTMRGKSVSAIVSGHVGTERWPVYIESPSVLTLAEDARYGGTATMLFGLTDDWKLGVQTQIERIRWVNTDGFYGTVSMGVQYLPKL